MTKKQTTQDIVGYLSNIAEKYQEDRDGILKAAKVIIEQERIISFATVSLSTAIIDLAVRMLENQDEDYILEIKELANLNESLSERIPGKCQKST